MTAAEGSSATDDAIGLISAFAADELAAYREIMADVADDPERVVAVIGDLLAVLMTRLDHVATEVQRSIWELIAESRSALERALERAHGASGG